MNFQFVKRHDIRRTYSYWCEIDEYESAGGEQFLLAHIRVTHWSPSVCKQLKAEFKTFRQHCAAPLFACPETMDKKWFKFVSMLGFQFQQNVTCNNGTTRPLFIHKP
jgi:hypothetical protein